MMTVTEVARAKRSWPAEYKRLIAIEGVVVV